MEVYDVIIQKYQEQLKKVYDVIIQKYQEQLKRSIRRNYTEEKNV
jgi:hypothetical protein